MGEGLEPVLGESSSAQTVSRIAGGLDPAVRAFHQRRLRDEYVYIFLDGVVLKVRNRTSQVRRRGVWVAYGIMAEGRGEVIACQLARGESETSGTAFLRGTFLRGLEGRGLRRSEMLDEPVSPADTQALDARQTEPEKYRFVHRISSS